MKRRSYFSKTMGERNEEDATEETKLNKGKKLLKEFETTIGMAELRALGKVSLERPLSDTEYKRAMKLKGKFLDVNKEIGVWN